MQTTACLNRTKVRFLFYFIFVFVLAILSRLIYLQIYQADKLFSLSQKNFTRIIKIACIRGNIVDINGHLLATNRPVIDVYWTGTGKKKLSNEQLESIQILQKILNIDLSSQEEINKLKIAEKYLKDILIKSDISFEELSQISEQFSASSNIIIDTKFQRFYPHNELACHLVGYLSTVDLENIGTMGLEKILEDDLRGEPGKVIATINSLGKSLSKNEIKPALSGNTIKTNIDIHLQRIAEDVFPKNYNGSLIIMNSKDGAIKTIFSKPNFDPQKFLEGFSCGEWNELKSGQPLLNRALCSCYPPASIFKLVTTAAALELGIINQESKWCCRGFLNFGNRDYFCAHKEGHGLITTKEAVSKSCNTFFYEIAKHIDIDTLANYAKKFGLGESTGIILPEKKGLIPNSQWKSRVYGEKWWPGETLSAVIGQSYICVPPIQIVRMIGGIFEGYLVNPRILESEEVVKKPLNIRKDVREFLQQSMRTAVSAGTGQRVNKIRDITVYAKTGTAQTSSLEKRDLGREFMEHAWFVSYFSYKDQEWLTMVIMIENAGSSRVAVETAKEILIRYRKLLETEVN